MKKTKEQVIVADWAKDFFVEFFRGEHHLPGQIHEFGNGYCVNIQASLSTYDDSEMTRLVLLSHKYFIRAQVQSAGFYLKICIWQRKEAGSRWQRHPSILNLIEDASSKKYLEKSFFVDLELGPIKVMNCIAYKHHSSENFEKGLVPTTGNGAGKGGTIFFDFWEMAKFLTEKSIHKKWHVSRLQLVNVPVLMDFGNDYMGTILQDCEGTEFIPFDFTEGQQLEEMKSNWQGFVIPEAQQEARAIRIHEGNVNLESTETIELYSIVFQANERLGSSKMPIEKLKNLVINSKIKE